MGRKIGSNFDTMRSKTFIGSPSKIALLLLTIEQNSPSHKITLGNLNWRTADWNCFRTDCNLGFKVKNNVQGHKCPFM